MAQVAHMLRRAVKLPTSFTYSPLLLLLAAIVGTSFLGLGFIMPLRALYGRSVGASSLEIGLMASSFLLAGFLAAPLMGRLTDRYGPTTVLWVGLVASHSGFSVPRKAPASCSVRRSARSWPAPPPMRRRSSWPASHSSLARSPAGLICRGCLEAQVCSLVTVSKSLAR
jgi:hypothetical protein